MTKDLHERPFDEGTLAKLSIFRNYIREWLPVFISARNIIWDTINIYDFFSGPGKDCVGQIGTPLIIMEELKPYLNQIKLKNLTVNLYFNEIHKTKHKQLVEELDNEVGKFPFLHFEFDSKDFKIAFDKMYPSMQNNKAANLIFLDQSGIKHISEEVFNKLISLKTSDFLFFTSSSTMKRFCEHPLIAKYIRLTTDEVDCTPYYKIHKLVLEYYKSLIPSENKYRLAPFSIKKHTGGIYGLIFGSSHVLGLEKFLKTCWANDTLRGEANYDIDDENIIENQIDLFSGSTRKPKKLEIFETDLFQLISSKVIRTDKDAYLFTIERGIAPTIGKESLSKLVKEKKIEKGKFEISSKICKKDFPLTEIKIIL